MAHLELSSYLSRKHEFSMGNNRCAFVPLATRPQVSGRWGSAFMIAISLEAASFYL
jgi:hypothetical protein